MRRLLPKAAILSWLVSTPEQKLRFELVDALYSTPKSIFAASAAALFVVATTLTLSGDRVYAWIFVAFLAVGIGRAASLLLYRISPHKVDDCAATAMWERRALVGAWAFAFMVGSTGAYTVIMHPNSDVELLVSCCVMGYIAGISSRNASRPIISIGQVMLTAVPFLIALVARLDLVHSMLAAFIGALLVSIIVICRAVFENIISRHTAFSRIELLARRDALTDLWNRKGLIELLEKRLSGDAKSGEIVTLILIDLDRFKDINDTFGHQTGDAVLKEVGDRIKSVTNPGNEVARIGGDEFVVILTGTDEEQPQLTAERIFATFAHPFTVGINQHLCGASIGYAIAPRRGATLEQLFRNADLALYEAKQAGRRQIVRHTLTITERYDRRVLLEHDLQFALQNGEMELNYQPIVDPRSGRAICCEALLRWNHPSLGQISPMEFIPLAETTGLIVPIGGWVLDTACREAGHWPTDISVAVNLSAVQFRRSTDLVAIVTGTLAATGLAARRLVLEITESVLIEDSAAALTVLERLREHGIGISLDDFGTGFASLAYLNDFPFSKIKIDRKFSQAIDTSPRTAAIIGGIAKTTRDLHIELVAEGVETENQLERMSRFGINAMQGYLFCHPLPASEIRKVIVNPILTEAAKRHALHGRPVTPRRKAAS
ncbi:MAG TPA: EAL domain-containing protein [Xanthobacteraceae bacterium]|nr:EAL domain-containing protein [Xanthobacteraceae bacterium]